MKPWQFLVESLARQYGAVRRFLAEEVPKKISDGFVFWRRSEIERERFDSAAIEQLKERLVLDAS